MVGLTEFGPCNTLISPFSDSYFEYLYLSSPYPHFLLIPSYIPLFPLIANKTRLPLKYSFFSFFFPQYIFLQLLLQHCHPHETSYCDDTIMPFKGTKLNPSPHYDVVIVGGGAVGLSAALEAAKRGKSVLVIERFSLLNQNGSSGGFSRMFRTVSFINYFY